MGDVCLIVVKAAKKIERKKDERSEKTEGNVGLSILQFEHTQLLYLSGLNLCLPNNNIG